MRFIINIFFPPLLLLFFNEGGNAVNACISLAQEDHLAPLFTRAEMSSRQGRSEEDKEGAAAPHSSQSRALVHV